MIFSTFFEKIFDTARGNVNLRRDYGKVRKSVSSFLADDYSCTDHRIMLVPGWAESYRQYLLTQYTPNISAQKRAALDATPEAYATLRESTADNHMRILRRIIRIATATGLLPDIDILHDIPAYRRSRPAATPDFAGMLHKLAHRVDDALSPDINLYLMCLSLGGIPPAQAAAQDSAGLFLSRMRGRTRIVTCNDESLNKMRRIFRAIGLELLADDIFTDWLCIAIATRAATRAEIGEICRSRFAVAPCRPDSNAAARISSRIADIWEAGQKAAIEKFWIAITSFHRPAYVLADELLCHTPGSTSTPGLAHALYGNIYCPCTASAAESRDSASGTIRNILFAHVHQDTARLIEKTIRDIHIFRSGTEPGAYTHIPASQLQLMHNLLNRFGSTDDADLCILEPGTESPTLSKDDIVTIDLPGYEGTHAVVARKDLSRSTATNTYYTVTFTAANSFRIHLTVLSTLLTPLKQ